MKTVLLSSLSKIFSDESPCAASFVGFSMLKNERKSFQVGVFCDTDTAVTPSVKSAISDCISVYRVGNVPSGLPCYADSDDFFLRKTAGEYPDILYPTSGEITLNGRAWTGLWFELVPDGKYSAGSYEIKISIGTELVSLTVEIIDASLPEQTLKCTNWFHTDCLATSYNIEVFSEEYWRITENYVRTAVEHGINLLLTPLFTPPLDTQVGGERPTVQLVRIETDDSEEYKFNFDQLTRWIEMCDRCGVKYFEMSHLFTQWGAKHAPKIMATVKGKHKKIFGWSTPALGRKYKNFLTQFTLALKEYINDKGIGERCFFHISDEPNSSNKRSYKAKSSFIRSLLPDYRVIDALSDYDFYTEGLVETPVPSVDGIEPFIGNVPDLWAYYCCGQHRNNVPNRFIAMPSVRNRILGTLLYKFNAEGFLQWGYNFWYSQLSIRQLDPYKETDADGKFPSGDAFVVYPGENGMPVVSLRLKVFYDGFQDMMAMQLLEELTSHAQVVDIIENGLDLPLKFSEYPHDEEWLLNMRERINAAIKVRMCEK